MTNDKRLELELSILRKMCRSLCAAGYSLSVWDGEEWAIKRSTQPDIVLAELRATDEEQVRVRDGDTVIGTIYLVYGNSPWEVISDNSVSLEAALAETTAFAEAIELKYSY